MDLYDAERYADTALTFLACGAGAYLLYQFVRAEMSDPPDFEERETPAMVSIGSDVLEAIEDGGDVYLFSPEHGATVAITDFEGEMPDLDLDDLEDGVE